MSIQTTKLSEVEVTQSAVDPKLLIEDEGEIKRISPEVVAPSQVQADWEETDASSPAYILNKPESLGGSGGEIIEYYIGSGTIMNGGTLASKATVVDQWNKGYKIRIKPAKTSTTIGDVVGISYSLVSSAVSGDVILTYI